MTESAVPASFGDLNLPAPLLAALDAVGYETPSPIQLQAIPYLLKGHDLLGHAPTGTGKTAAFALPLLARIKLNQPKVQVLVLAPTRELAQQVAEAFATYASALKGFHVLPIYGGQDYGPQLQRLKRGVHVVVGTPGRVKDHLRRGTLKLEGLQAVVLDEADEMLRMGFLDDVEWILQQTPARRQIALFSATLPKEVRKITQRYLRDPREVTIKARTASAETIRQRYWPVRGLSKFEALNRILAVEASDGVLIFVRTKSATATLAERLADRGVSVAAMNGDMAQRAREQTIDRFKRGSLDVLVATDVAARGLDVNRISHVINFDIPYDTEAYIHRIGRTGRAGRTGEAILFVAPREQRMLAAIERATRQRIDPLQLPTPEMVQAKRTEAFKEKISATRKAGGLAAMQALVEQYQQEHGVNTLEVAAALAQLAMAAGPDRSDRRQTRSELPAASSSKRRAPAVRAPRSGSQQSGALELFRIEVGLEHGVAPGNIVGAIANEAGLDASQIGRVHIEQWHSTVELPQGMPDEIYRDLQKVWVCGQALKISRSNRQGSSRRTPAAGVEVNRGDRKKSKGKKKLSKKKLDKKKAQRNQAGKKKRPKPDVRT